MAMRKTPRSRFRLFMSAWCPKLRLPWDEMVSAERLREERQRHVHPVVDVRVRVVELLVGVRDAGKRQALGEDAAAELDMVLVARAAIDVDAAQRPEVAPVVLH